MMVKTSFYTRVSFLLLLGLTQGCVSTQTIKADSHKSQQAPLTHIIVAGDLLGDIASRYTGKVSLWREIAEFNEIEDPKALRVGDTIVIPQSLLVETEAELKSDIATAEKVDAASEGPVGANMSTTATNALAMKRRTQSDNTKSEVVLSSVETNRRFILNPIDQASLGNTPSKDVNLPRVKVIGTYFPKGIYQEPASYSTLIKRVAPGTVFELQSEINDWYKIVTSDGIGYLRVIDGKIVTD